ncbi:NAD-dependent epimerase/dehydratase family protein [Roseateles cellulosilyticus]|uniref:NAD(P)H-binding protein n=1 Tax=Pelomonas cellulosilytica TaxID=2906762 RepID=A0ABS8XXJ6_9BURK|nr:NAD-dependent epimerase/dehydratase family protein [Pelomonas sp. P8]MCE4557381.1 NAD(P)H-binding protein [Pelomonas sp. P8]
MTGKDRTALVLGASGGIGGEVARQMRAAGWRVVALKRGLAVARETRENIDWRRGDAMNAADVRAAAEGCGVIVHAVNPPGYRDWDRLVLPMLANSIAAATAQRATLVLPGTVYNFGPDAFPLLREDAPQHPATRKGAIRAAMEKTLREASDVGLRVLIVRAGDFFGPRAGNNWFSQALLRPGRPVATLRNPAAAGVGHQWAYLPDVARTMLALLERRDTLPAFASFHLAGHWDADGRQMAEAIQRVVARRTGRTPRIAPLPWWLFDVASPFVATFREMREMRYLWQQPVQLDNARLVATLGHEPHTPLDEAVEASLQGLGCLPAVAEPCATSASG